jgi:hypothetical protein
MLVVLAYRTDEAERSECLRALLPALRATTGPAFRLSEITIEELGAEEAREMARAELTRSGAAPPSSERAAAIARESGGWPFFIRELCQAEGALDGAQPSLEAMLWTRVAALPLEARRLLEIIAVAGRPIKRGSAVRAAALGDRGPSALGLLCKDHLVRVLGDRSRDEIDVYHDRIRETVLARLSSEAKKGHHLALATALLSTERADEETPEFLRRLRGAGERR